MIKKTFDKKESFFVLLFIAVFSLIIVCFSFSKMNEVKDMELEAVLVKLNTNIIEYYVLNNVFPEEDLCNIKDNCFNLKSKVKLFTNKDIYYASNKKNYILYSSSFKKKNVYFVIDADFTLRKSLEIPTL